MFHARREKPLVQRLGALLARRHSYLSLVSTVGDSFTAGHTDRNDDASLWTHRHVELPADIWISIWLIMPNLDRLDIPHVCKSWRQMALDCALLWAACDYSESREPGSHSVDDRRLRHSGVLRLFLERSNPHPFKLGVRLYGPAHNQATGDWSSLLHVIGTNRARFTHLLLKNAPSEFVEGIFNAGGLSSLQHLGIETDDSSCLWTPAQLRRIAGSSGFQTLRLSPTVYWSSEISGSIALKAEKPCVTDLGTITILRQTHLSAFLAVFNSLRALSIKLLLSEHDDPGRASVRIIDQLARLETFSVSLVPPHPLRTPPHALGNLLPPGSTSRIAHLAVDITSTRGVESETFALFADLAADDKLVLEVTVGTRDEEHGAGRTHKWTLTSALRSRSLFLHDAFDTEAITGLFAALAAKPAIKTIKAPAGLLADILRKAPSTALNSIATVDTQLTAGIMAKTPAPIEPRWIPAHERTTVPEHLRPELDPASLPVLHSLQTLILRSRFAEEPVTVEAEGVVRLVNALCGDSGSWAKLILLDLSGVRTKGWKSRGREQVAVLADRVRGLSRK